MSRFLQRIDLFKAKQIDEKSSTSLGGILTVLFPFIIAGYIYWQASKLAQQPATTRVDQISNFTILYNVTVQCQAVGGCWFTQNFKSDTDVCAKAVKEKYKEANLSLIGRCTYFNPGENLTIHYCFDSDPINGPTFIWKRTAPASSCGSVGSTCGTQYSGLTLFLNTLVVNPSASVSDLEVYNVTTDNISMFYGVHALAATRLSSGSSDSRGIWQIVPLLVSQGEDILSSNICCTKNSVPANQGQNQPTGTLPQFQPSPTNTPAMMQPVDGPGYVYNSAGVKLGETECDANNNANDYQGLVNGTIQTVKGQYYQLKFRAYPSYTKAHTSKSDLVSTLLANIGGGINIVMTVCLALVTFWRQFWPAGANNKLSKCDPEFKKSVHAM